MNNSKIILKNGNFIDCDQASAEILGLMIKKGQTDGFAHIEDEKGKLIIDTAEVVAIIIE